MANRSSYSDFLNKGYVLNNGVFEKPSSPKPKSVPAVTASQFDEGYRHSNDTVVFNINPIGKPRMTSGDKANHRSVTQKYWDYKSELNRLAAEANYVMGDKVDVEFHIAMPDSWSKSKKESMNGKPHQQVPDVDNIFKALGDSLKKQDKDIWYVKATKYWSYTGKIIINR